MSTLFIIFRKKMKVKVWIDLLRTRIHRICMKFLIEIDEKKTGNPIDPCLI